MKVIEGNKDHIDACISIARSLTEYFTEKAIKTIERDINSNVFYVSVDFDNVVGFIIIKIKSNEIAEILWMGVKSEKQNLGHGTELINHVVAYLKKKGIKLLEVKTLSEIVDYEPYKKTEKFYRNRGFILKDIIDDCLEWEPGNPCAIYVKPLGFKIKHTTENKL